VILHHLLEGTGPAVLLLHSTAADARQWQPQIRELRRDFTVVAPDLRGYGRSPLTSAPFSHAGDIVRLLDHLRIDRCAVVGSSGGGAVALQVASAVPDRVDTLVLLCAAAEGVEPTAELRAFGARESALLRDGDVAGATDLNVAMWLQPEVAAPARELFREMQSNAFRVQLAAGDDVHEEDAEVDLARISCPATVVTGDRDLAWFGAVGDHLASALERAVRVELPWAGHLPNLERPTETTELIRRSIRPGPRTGTR
jgi:pimeloyl-ACP methyl ester carboxylesterase